MANKRPQTLLDSIDPDGDESDDRDDVDFTLPETRRPGKRRKLPVGAVSTPGLSSQYRDTTAARIKEEEEQEKMKLEKKKRGEEEWERLMQLEDEAKAERSRSGPSDETAPIRSGGEVEMVRVKRPRNFAGEVI